MAKSHFLELIAGFKRRGSRLPQLGPHADDLSVLPQFRSCVRIEKIVPLPAQEEPAGWYGGKPQMPDGMEWPMQDGKPMLFLAQLNCSFLPQNLWGGAGPREGWLLFFLPLTVTASTPAIECKVLHFTGMATERSVDVSEEDFQSIIWIMRDDKNFLPRSAAPFPKWPVRFHEMPDVAEGAGEAPSGNPPVPAPASWSPAEYAYPFTPELFQHQLNSLNTKIGKQCSAFKSRWRRHYAGIKAFEAKDPAAITHHEKCQYEIDCRGIAELRKHAPSLAAAKAKVEQAAAPFSRLPRTQNISSSDWMAFLNAMEGIEFPAVEWQTERNGESRYYKTDISYSLPFDERPKTYGEYAEKLGAVITGASGFVKSASLFGSKAEKTIAFQKRYADEVVDKEITSPDLLEFKETRRKLAQENIETHEKAMSFLPECRERAFALRNEIGGRERYGEEIDDQSWAAIQPKLQGLVIATEKSTLALPAFPSLEATDIVYRPILGGPAGSSHRWHGRFKVGGIERYSSESASLPEGPRQYAEYMCLNAAEKHQDGMGGVPRWDWVDTSWFSADLYRRPEDQSVMFTDYNNRRAAPYDKDNALLLQLFSSDLPGWIFGDLSHIVFVIPRDKLTKADFSDVKVIVQG
ncbi:MAG: DUF1963 domain-containing protein [Rhodobacteraceae bacterium]|nr:DUF1963 domain-containing protein [Paracoccaceae bacterium]